MDRKQETPLILPAVCIQPNSYQRRVCTAVTDREVYSSVREQGSAGAPSRFHILQGLLELSVKWRPRVVGKHNVGLERSLGELGNERNPWALYEGAAITKGHLDVSSPGLCSRQPPLLPSAFSEAAMASLEVNRLSGHMCSWNRGPWRPSQPGKLCTQLQNCVWIMGLGTPSW